jgi:hypothetical protein
MKASNFVIAEILVFFLVVQGFPQTKPDRMWGKADVRSIHSYRGLDGRLVQFYSVNGRKVQETKQQVTEKGMPITVREFRISPARFSIVMTLASSGPFGDNTGELRSNASRTVIRRGDEDEVNAIWFSWKGEGFLGFDNLSQTHIDPSEKELQFRVIEWSGDPDDWDKFVLIANQK